MPDFITVALPQALLANQIVDFISDITRKCMTLWGEPDRVHAQNMEQLHAFDCHQNVAEPQATENHMKYTHVYTGTVNQAWL